MHKIIKENIFPLEWNLSDLKNVKSNGYKVFGTFVCGGGSTMGYKLAGYNHIGGVEFTEHYSKIYKKNHNPKYFYQEDIRKFNKRNDLPEELFNLDILDGSPPCAAFSTAGAREKNWGKSKLYEGIKQVKDDLVYIYCDTIKKLSPKVFILENVSGLAKGNAKIYLKNIIKTLSDKYNVQVFLLHAASMGIPQVRGRIFIIGHKKEFKLPDLELKFQVKQVGFDITKKYWENGGISIEKYAIGDEWDNIKIGCQSKKYFNLIKPAYRKPCCTITETSSNKGAASVVHPVYKRKLNKEEITLLSTFPRDYDFMDVNYTSVMGRSVLPVMMANISNQIYMQWLSKI